MNASFSNHQLMTDFIYPHSIEQAQAEGMTIIDIRHASECTRRLLPQADTIIEMSELLAHPAQYLSCEARYLLVCAGGIRTRYAAALLAQQGYTNVWAFPSSW